MVALLRYVAEDFLPVLTSQMMFRLQCNLPIRVPFVKDKDILTQRFISTGGVIIINLS